MTECKISLELAKRMRDEFAGMASMAAMQAARSKVEKLSGADGLEKAANEFGHLVNLLTAAIYEATRLEEADPTLSDLPVPKAGEQWRHFKGDTITVSNVVLHSESKDVFVIYEHLGKGWALSLSMWHEAEPKMGGRRRFELAATEKPHLCVAMPGFPCTICG